MALSNREVVEAIFEASAAGDEQTIRSLVHDDIRIIEADSLPYAGTFTGPDEFIGLTEKVFGAWDDASQTTDHVIADGDHVVILGRFEGRGKSTGRHFDVPLAAVWRLEDGKVREIRPFYFDTKVMHDAHGGGTGG